MTDKIYVVTASANKGQDWIICKALYGGILGSDIKKTAQAMLEEEYRDIKYHGKKIPRKYFKLVEYSDNTELLKQIEQLQAENAALRERLKKAVELPFYVFDKKTGKEADEYEIALNEDWAKHLMYCDMDGFAIEHDGTLMLIDECGQHAYCPSDRFEICNEARLKELQGGEE